jgi:small-conductance mechanosensitive channel
MHGYKDGFVCCFSSRCCRSLHTGWYFSVRFPTASLPLTHDFLCENERVQASIQANLMTVCSHCLLYRERRNLAKTLQDNDDVIETLEMLIGAVMHVFALLPYLLIFNVQVTPILFSLSSVSVAGAFVFGNSLKTVYESVVFIFVIRPYQVRCFVFERAQILPDNA